MSTDAIFAVTRFGLDFERARMEVASQRIATSDLPVAQRVALQTATGASFDAHLQAPAADQPAEQLAAGESDGSERGDGTRQVLDPGNPMANSAGMVNYPDVDLAQEMTTLMSAQRAYQADIRAFNTLHGMMMKSLSIGGRG
jgi:flagellar basal-body rod protein FlgC